MQSIKKFLLVLFSVIITGVYAQIKDPVKFKLEVNKLGENEYEAILVGKLENGWHIYSKDIPEDSGIPTEMKLLGKNIEPIGKVTEVGKKIDEFSEAFGARIVYYSNTVSFKQKFKLKDAKKSTNVSAEITYQTCDDRVCLAPNTIELQHQIKIEGSDIKDEEILDKKENSETPKDTSTDETQASQTLAENQKLDTKNLKIQGLDYKNPLVQCGTEQTAKTDESYLTYLL